jgi:hypothetical protein
MILHNQLQGPGLSRLIKDYFRDMLQAGNFHFDGPRLMVKLNYQDENEFYCIGGLAIQGGNEEIVKAAQREYVNFILVALGGKMI